MLFHAVDFIRIQASQSISGQQIQYMRFVRHLKSLLFFLRDIVRRWNLNGFLFRPLFVTKKVTKFLHRQSETGFNGAKWLIKSLCDLTLSIAVEISQFQGLFLFLR